MNQTIFNLQSIQAELETMPRKDLEKYLSHACALVENLRDERDKYKKKIISIKAIMEGVK